MFNDDLLRALRTGALLGLLIYIGAFVLVFVLSHLDLLLNADLATPLIVVGVAIFVLVTGAIKYQRRLY